MGVKMAEYKERKSRRRFRTRKKLPKDEIKKDIEDGLTLEEIGAKYNTVKSVISEFCTQENIETKNVGRRKKEEERKAGNFFEEFYLIIKKDIK